MKKISLFSLLIILFISCETSYDSSKELSINIEIQGDDVTGEVRLQRVNSDYSIELVQSANFLNNKSASSNPNRCQLRSAVSPMGFTYPENIIDL